MKFPSLLLLLSSAAADRAQLRASTLQDVCYGRCAGWNECAGATAAIGDCSCNGNTEPACWYASGSIGEYSCNGNEACKESSADIGSYSCVGKEPCEEARGTIGDNSCNKKKACKELADAKIGANSCNGNEACREASSVIGSNSCTGEKACRENRGTIGDNSCNESFACDGNLYIIPDNCPSLKVYFEGGCIEPGERALSLGPTTAETSGKSPSPTPAETSTARPTGAGDAVPSPPAPSPPAPSPPSAGETCCTHYAKFCDTPRSSDCNSSKDFCEQACKGRWITDGVYDDAEENANVRAVQ